MKIYNMNYGIQNPNYSPGYKWHSWSNYTKSLNNQINSLIYYTALFDPEYKVLNSIKNLDQEKYPEFNTPGSDWYWDFLAKNEYFVLVATLPKALLEEPIFSEYNVAVLRYNEQKELSPAELNSDGTYTFIDNTLDTPYFYVDTASGSLLITGKGFNQESVAGSHIYYVFTGNKLDFRQGIINFNKNGYVCSGGLEALENSGATYAGVDEYDNIGVWLIPEDNFSELFSDNLLAEFLVGYILFSKAREEKSVDNLQADARQNLDNYFFFPLATASFFTPVTTAEELQFINNEELASKTSTVDISLNWEFHRYSYYSDTQSNNVCGWYDWHSNNHAISILAKDIFNKNNKYIQDSNGGSWVNSSPLSHELQYYKNSNIESFYTDQYDQTDAININNQFVYTYNIFTQQPINLAGTVKILLF